MAQRRPFMAAIVLMLCVFACGLSAVDAWLARGQEFILPNAQDVHVEGGMPMHMTIMYTLPHGQTVRDIQSRLAQHGWQRIRLPPADSEAQPLIFVRRGAWGALREVVHIYPAVSAQHGVEIHVGRCIKIGSYLRCL